MAPIRDSVSHSPNQTGLEHPGLDSQYEPSPWSSGSPCSTDSNTNWSKVLVDGSIDKANSSSDWPPSSSSFSCSSSSSSSGCGSGSDPELASECMDADCSSSVGSDKCADSVATVKMMSANTSSSVVCTSSAPHPSSGTSTMMISASVNGDANGNKLASIIGGSSANDTITNSIGSNNLGNHNKLLNNSGVWGSQSDSNLITGGSAPCINGGLNPHVMKINANHGAWPQGRASSPASQDQRPPQAPGITSKQSIAPQQGPVLGWGGMAAPGNKIEDTETNNGTASTKVLGSSSGNGGQSANLNTESNGPNNTIKMNTTTTTTTTNTIMTSTQPNSITSSQFMGDCSWGTIGVGTGAPLANGNLSSAPPPTQADLGGKGAFGTPWGASTYPGDKGPQNVDTVNLQNPALMQAGNPQISSAAFKSNNNHNNTGAPRWDQGPSSNPANSHSTMSWTGGSAEHPGSIGQSGSGNQSTMGPPTGMPRPWGSSASSSSSCSSSSSMSKMSHGEWGSATPSNPPSDNQKGNSSNGWKSLEDDAMGMGNAAGGHGLGAGTGGWGRSGGSEGSGESSGGRSSSDRDNSLKGGNRRKGAQTATLISALTRSNVDPRVLSNAGWGQTPVRQNTAWDVNSAPTHQQVPREEQKHPGWGAAPPAPSQTSAGWGNATPEPGWGEQRSMSTWENKTSGNGGSGQSGWDDGSNSSNTWNNSMNKEEGSNMWSNAPKPVQSWNGSTGESWGNNGEASRAGASNHWGDPPKGAGSMGWESDSDRSGSGCWSEPGRNNASSSNTWGGSGGSNTPDHSTPNPGSNWGEPVHKPSPMSKHQGWGEPMKNNSSTQNWGETTSKPLNSSNEWGKGPESSTSRGGQGTNKPSGWLGGPMPAVGPKEEMATGWEEPSPESVRRKMEIDDGTAAWGDPGKYGGGSVNMWNKPGQTDQDGPSTPNQNHSAMRPPQPMQPQEKTSGTGWGDPYPPQKESSTWGEPAPPVPVSVDNGTSAWGKPMDTSGWEDSGRDGREGSGWGSQQKSGPKPMGTWGGDESNTWDQEEEVEIGMWNDSQQDTRSHDQNTWNYKQKNSKMSKPVPKQDEPWMKPFVNQFNSMSFSRESSEEPMKPGMMLDKRMDMGSMGDLNGVMGKNLGSRHPLHKDPMDRSPYFDKNVKSLMGGSSVAQGRGGPHAQVPPQHSLRNQVPPPILPSQVPPSLLKYPGGNGGLNPLLGPQQVAMLNQISQFNQLSQLNHINHLQRLLLQQQQQQQQQQKAQTQRAMAVGRPSEQVRPIGSSPLMMQPPRHLDSSFMKQPPPMKPYLDNYFSHNNPDMQKDTAPLGPFGNFPLSVNSNLNVPMDMGGSGSLNYKEPPQSRLKKLWATDPLEQNSKPGAMSSGLRLEDSPFYDFLSPGPSPLSPPGQSLGSVGDSWPPRANSPPPHGTTGTWPPEFRPGEPWKGYPNIDPQTDPHLTPGSVINNLSINTVRDTDHLRDRNNGPSSSLNTTMPSNSAWPSIRASSHSSSLTSTAQSTSARPADSKWSPGGSSVSNTSLAHELWKVPLPSKGLSVAAPSRPPPGLTTQKPSSSSSGWDSSSLRLGGWSPTESRFTPGSSWSDSSSGRTQWLVLKNLTPQIDGSTLKTLCMQHGPLDTFHLNLPHGNAVVCYRSKEEAAKAQKSLHMCVLGNTTILADIATEEEIKGFFAQGQTLATPSSGWQAIGSSQSRMEQSHPFPSRAVEPNQWNSSDLHSTSLWGGPNYSSGLWGSASGTEAGRMSSPSPISSFLPVDHLTGAGDSM
ncbi:trinucleotide repeat-containing gene 6A protein isoform X1 [Boleophthalmus pectinirostris]|uniref:trinucleotide repeat-containing gene 6A protein isoform X1 n=2 Tax=Boleophthalmus pectinirostris TaxID=150288 RepID=UPI00242A5886|nr:trinucleotide repeat-containing gene 6A protein isoform X1 [Boleophthalmus pectinirostris]